MLRTAKTPFVTFHLVAVLAVGLHSSHEAHAQTAPYAFPSGSPLHQPRSNIRVTYGGNIIMDMGNYDIVFGSPNRNPLTLGPTLPEDLTGLSDEDAAAATSIATAPQIVFKGQSGARWDGSNYLYHPAYPNDLVTRNRFLNRVVGRGQEQYPPARDCSLVPCTNGIGTQPQLTQQQRAANSQFDEYMRGLHQRRRQANRGAFQLPLSTATGEPNPELCEQHPYLVQCRPAWVQPRFNTKQLPSSKPLAAVPQPKLTRPSWQLDLPSPKPYATKATKRQPIVIFNRDSAEVCSYSLLSAHGEQSFTLNPGEKHVFSGDRAWRIRFDSSGMGTKTYKLRAGDSYQFTKNQSDVWELHRRQQLNKSDAGKSKSTATSPES